MQKEEGTEKNEAAALDRIVFFSDAVIAIAITLMVLDIRVPDGTSPELLPQALLDLWPKYFSYVLSFVIVAVYWIEHHRMFTKIKRYDRRLIWLNFLFLLFMAFLPFTTDLIGEYGDEPIAVILYAGIGAAVGFSKSAIWWYASHDYRLIDKSTSWKSVRMTRAIGMIAPAVFLVSLGIVPFSPDGAMYFWTAIVPLIYIVHRLMDEH